MMRKKGTRWSRNRNKNRRQWLSKMKRWKKSGGRRQSKTRYAQSGTDLPPEPNEKPIKIKLTNKMSRMLSKPRRRQMGREKRRELLQRRSPTKTQRITTMIWMMTSLMMIKTSMARPKRFQPPLDFVKFILPRRALGKEKPVTRKLRLKSRWSAPWPSSRKPRIRKFKMAIRRRSAGGKKSRRTSCPVRKNK